MEEKVLAALQAAEKPLKAAEIAVQLGVEKVDVDKAIKKLVKEGKANSPIRCAYAAV
ncbi:hypothetical protein BN938_1199 [Mucinivorans hirudinis]|uniref:Uncharacterized protein n=1 Tax=Mucinivorans hirudinis TaxID=1433126 RepID=A0A060RBY9_9BACT|nr:hypothetical protein BN938_1199 [Mucinivorans hirudinis]